LDNLLGIDFGERYIGLAIKKENLAVPYAHKVIDKTKSNLIKELKKTILEEGITKIIIGNPIGLSNNVSRMSKLVDEFITKDLSTNFNIPIVKIDERFTSKVLSKSKSKRNDDLSAVKILESFDTNE
tara:strand:- start:169 stop:549 length:381 start_codon:yes stop_codon:yes gene_type:complete